MVDSVKLRCWLACRVEEWRRVSAIVGLGINGGNAAGIAYIIIGGGEWWLFPALFATVLTTALVASWAYYNVLQMRRAELEAHFNLNVRDQTVLSPKEAKLLGLLARAMRGDAAAIDELVQAAETEQI